MKALWNQAQRANNEAWEEGACEEMQEDGELINYILKSLWRES
jgi:hypothetical protein